MQSATKEICLFTYQPKHDNIVINIQQQYSLQQINRHCGYLFLLLWTIAVVMISLTYDTHIDWEISYDCIQTASLSIYGYLNLRNCSHDMVSLKTTVQSYKVEFFHYDPNVTKFPIYSCSYTVVKLKHYQNLNM